jgi:hypothetical protein
MPQVFFGDPAASATYNSDIHGDFDFIKAIIRYLKLSPADSNASFTTARDNDGHLYLDTFDSVKAPPTIDDLLNLHAAIVDQDHPIFKAIDLYAPTVKTYTVVRNNSWTAFDGLMPVRWDSPDYPAPTEQDLLDAMDGSNLLSITDWHNHGTKATKNAGGFPRAIDVGRVRSEINSRLQAQGWENLSADEQRICAMYMLGTDAQRAAAMPSQAERIATIIDYRQSTLAARRQRHALTQLMVFSFVPKPEYEQVFDAIGVDKSSKYIDLNFLGFCNGDTSSGILDYILSYPGSIFENNGFVELDFIPKELTKEQIRDLIADVFLNG